MGFFDKFKKKESVRKVHFEIWFEPFYEGEEGKEYSDEELAKQFQIAVMNGFNKDLIKKGSTYQTTCRTEHFYKKTPTYPIS